MLLNPPFDTNITQYNIEVSNETTKLNIFAVPQNEKGKVIIFGNENLKEGKNTVSVTVTAANGITKREYKINVYKRNIEEEKSYQQEQEEQKNKLEEAYKIEKTSNNNEESSIQEIEKEKSKYILIGIIGAIVVMAITMGIIYYKKRKL